MDLTPWSFCVVGWWTLKDDVLCCMFIIVNRQNLLYWKQERRQQNAIWLSSWLFYNTSSHAWQSHSVSGSLARGTCDLIPASSRQFQLPLLTQKVQVVLWILPWMLLTQASILTCICTTAIQNLIYGYRNILQITTWHSTETLHPHVQQSINMSIQLPTCLKSDPVQMSSSTGIHTDQQGRLYHRVNVANTVTIYRVKTKVVLSSIQFPMTVTNH